MYHIVGNYSNKCRYFSSVNTFWTNLDNDNVIARINPLMPGGNKKVTDT